MHNPEVLFLDEPTTGLDPASRDSVWAEVRRLNADLGMTIFLTTQYLEEADELADRVGIISGGRLVAEGVPEALKRSLGQDMIVVEADGADPGALDVLRRLGVVDDVTTDGRTIAVAVALSTTGLEVTSLTVRTPTLDDVFRQLTGAPIEGDGPRR